MKVVLVVVVSPSSLLPPLFLISSSLFLRCFRCSWSAAAQMVWYVGNLTPPTPPTPPPPWVLI